MKKIKLLLAAMAAMVTMGANAQSWTASEVGAGNFMLYNVGTGQYLTKGNGWGTQASITTASTAGNGIAIKIEAVGTDFKLRTNINGDGKGLEHLSGGTVYTDQSANKNSTWTFTQVGTDNGPVYTIVSKDNHGGGEGVYLTAGVDGTIVTPGADGTIDGAKWKLMSIPAQPIGMDAASEENPVDATSLIVNANFSFPAILKSESWTMTSSNYNACGGNADNPCAESWRASFTLKQDITVPNGIYELTAQAAVTEYTVTGADMPVVYAGDQSTPFTAMTEGENSMGGVSTSFTSGKYVVGPIRVVVTSGSLTIGVRGTRTDTWCVWDNFKLTYKGLDLGTLRDALQSQIDAVSALEGTIPTAAYSAVKTYADGIDVASLSTEDAISAAASELASKVNAAKNLQSAYASYAAFKAAVEALDDDETVFTGDATIDVSAIDATVQATTTLEGLNAAIDAAKPQLQAAAAEFFSSVTLNEGKRFDITNIYLTNPDFEVPTANGQMPTGWTITITGQNCGQQNRTDTNPESGLAITNFIEAWHPSQLGSGVIAQTVNSLPEGTYVLECDASICHDPAGADDITGANLFIKSSLKTERQAISNVRLYINHYSLSFSHGGSGEVTFGLEADNTNANWLSADNFKVYYAGGVDLSIYEEALAEALVEAKSTAAKEDRMAASLRTALNNTIATYEGNEGLTSKTDIEEAIDNLNAAIAKVETSIASYKIIAAGIIPDNSIDGWVCENAQTFHVNTWSVEGNPGNDPSNMVTPFIENWVGRGEFLGEGKIYYRLEGLEPGEVFYASALVRSYNEASADAPNGPNFYINDSETNLTADGTTFTFTNQYNADMSGIYATLGTKATIGEDGVFELGVKIAANCNYNWVAFKNVRILNYDPNTTTIDETEAYTPVVKAGNVKLNRTIKEGYNTVVLPFGMTQEEVKANFGAEAKVYVVSRYDSEKANISFAETSGITANQPCILKATVAGTSYDLEDRIMTNQEPVFAATNVSMIGSYAASTTIAKNANNYIISNGNLYLVDSDNVSMKNTRAYIQLTEAAGVKVLTMSFDGETTGINEVNGMAIENGAIYNLAGQRVNKAVKGIFIINGKKVVK